MNATTMLLRKLHRIGEVLALLESDPRRRTQLMSDVIDEVMSYVALEENVFLPAAEPALGASARALRLTHVRARLALFRMATADTRDAVFVRGVRTLRETFREHALALAGVLRSLENVLPQETIAALGDEMSREACAEVRGDEREHSLPPRKRMVSEAMTKIVAA